MNMYENTLGKAALRSMGEIPNIIKTVEELAELQQALCKYLVGPVDADMLANIHEELADVSIMLNRMKLIFDPTAIQDWKDVKLDTLAERLGVEIKGG